MGAFYTLFLSLFITLLAQLSVVIFKLANQYFPTCSLAKGNKTLGKENGRYTHALFPLTHIHHLFTNMVHGIRESTCSDYRLLLS